VQPPDQSDDLVIATPERVAFQYEIAGIGSRFLAQFVDVAILTVVTFVIFIAATGLGMLFKSAETAILFALILGFIVVAGYFLVSEAVLSGQTLGKRAVRLRVVGDQGQPITLGQAAIRNLVRFVDFLPFFYGIGIITLFVNGRGKRSRRLRRGDAGGPGPAAGQPLRSGQHQLGRKAVDRGSGRLTRAGRVDLGDSGQCGSDARGAGIAAGAPGRPGTPPAGGRLRRPSGGVTR